MPLDVVLLPAAELEPELPAKLPRNLNRLILGPERAARLDPARSALDRGVRITIHNDAPVTPTRPMHLMWCAVARQTSAGNILGPEQRITPDEALRAHTLDAAGQASGAPFNSTVLPSGSSM